MSDNIAVFTIASKNYFAQVRTLMQSLAESNPHMDRFAVVADDFDDDFEKQITECRLISLEELDLPEIRQMEFRYDVMEFNTAVKPFALIYLLKKYKKVIYLDPDIYVYKRLIPIERAFENGSQIVLTPHLTGIAEEDGCHPDELDIRKAGIYNCGFIAVQDGNESNEMLHWWADRLEKRCVNKQQDGIFVDQSWIDLVPGYYRNVAILHDAGLNIAYWNLNHRRIDKKEDEFYVNGEPLYFFHFSGFDPYNIERISKHQNRFSLKDIRFARELFAPYAKKLIGNSYNDLKKMKYSFATYEDGRRILPEHRARYREDDRIQVALDDNPFLYSDFFYDGQEPELKKDGVNLVGYLSSEHGVGEASRLTAECLNAAEIKWNGFDFEYGNPCRKKETRFKNKINKCIKYDVSILNVNADQFPVLKKHSPETLWETYKIGVWYWELPEFPDQWLKSFLDVDEIWAPTKFIADVLNKVAPCPVLHMPPGIIREKPDLQKYTRSYYGLPEKPFLFLNMFDVYSFAGRKNPKAAIDAFKSKFAPDDMAVGLVLKLNNSSDEDGVRKKLDALIGDYKNIYIIAETLSREEVNGLLCVCDVAVSLHRSEGLGLLCEEAMCFGKPVIATGWSGNMDFMTPDNSCLVDFSMVDVGEDIGPYEKWQKWADPNVQQAADYMERLFKDKEFYHKIAQGAYETIAQKFSPKVCGQRMKERLSWIRDNKDNLSRDSNKRNVFFARCCVGTLQDFCQKQFDAEEKDKYVTHWTSNGNIHFETVAKDFQRAEIYKNSSDRDFLNAMYQRILHRTPSTEEVESYLQRMKKGLSRKEIVVGFLSSPEFLGSYSMEYREDTLKKEKTKNILKGFIKGLRREKA